MSRLHVIVCDDHRTMREALAAYLCLQPAVASTRIAANADEAIRLARRGGDVLVLDLRLGADESGLEVIEALNNLGIDIPVLVMGTEGDLDLVARALALGALGFCPKTARPTSLYDAVVQVAEGVAVIPDVAVVPLLSRLRQEQRVAEEAQALLARLTDREREVLRLLSHGVTRIDIARRLGVSGNTVRTHLRHLMDKLAVTSQLAAAARGRQLFDAATAAVAEPPTTAHVADLRSTAAESRLGD